MADAPEGPSLTVVGGTIDGFVMKLSPGTTVVIGSGRLAQLKIEHPDIDIAHVKVTWDESGLSVLDNASQKGIWVNGEPVEAAPLSDGDQIEFVGRGSRSTPPKVRVKVPKGSVPEPTPAAGRSAPPGAAPRAVGTMSRRTPRRRGGSPLREWRALLGDRRLIALAAALLVLLLGGWLTKRLFFSAPQVDSIRPLQGEPGQTVTLRGKRFAGDAAENVVWFGDRSSNASSSSGRELQVQVPSGVHPGTVRVTLETPAGRSRTVPFVAWEPLRAFLLDPPGARPGDEVVLAGSGFAEGAAVKVGGVPAQLVSVAPGALRFVMPEAPGTVGSVHPVVVSMGPRHTRPVPMYLGRVPLVVSFEPARGVAGDLVRIRGAGFAPAAEANAATFDGAPALVVAASPMELAVVVPPGRQPQAESLVPVVVRAGGRTSTEPASFPLQRLVEGAWVPRFFAEAVGEDVKEQATVGTEIAPVLLLAWKDDSRSVAERALQVAARLNAAVDRARLGQPVHFEAREQPAIGVALVGAADLIVRATPQDAAAYQVPPGLPARGGAPTPPELARHWAGVLEDTVVVATSAGQPTAALAPAAGAAFAQLRAAVPWQYGTGLPSSRVIALSGELKRRLREAALRVP
jgi:IPT/TIG domain-containing protein/FHA domain-containing protein